MRILDHRYLILPPDERKILRKIYRKWVKSHLSLYFHWINLSSMLGLSIAVPVLLLMSIPGGRKVALIGLVLLCFNIGALSLSYVSKTNKRAVFYIQRVAHIALAILNQACLFFLMLIIPRDTANYYFAAVGMFTSISIITLYPFWIEQYLAQTAAIIFLVIAVRIRPEFSHGFLLLIVIHLVVFFGVVYLRRIMCGELFERYRNLCAIMPRFVAEKLTYSSESVGSIKDFEPRERFVICLRSDWRNYQTFLEKQGSAKAIQLLESFYDSVIEDLNRIIPDGSFFATWTADELFVIFFDKLDSKAVIAERALTFATSMMKNLPQKILQRFNYPLIYDIGMASGTGFLGLLGPRNLKTTSVIGLVCELARALEYEAKMIRYFHDVSNPLPIVAFDQLLFDAAEVMKVFPTQDFSVLKSENNLLQNKTYYFWQPSVVGNLIEKAPLTYGDVR